MKPILMISDLQVSYKNTPIIKDISLSVMKGEIIGIVGESGSGKSTLLKACMGLLGLDGYVDKGSIVFNGFDLVNSSEKQLSKIRGSGVGMVFQNPGSSLCPIRTIERQFLETMKCKNKIEKEQAAKIIKQLFLKLNLPDYERIMKSYPFELSGGMNQRVGIALAMVLNPSLLLADEPTSALDVTVQVQVVKELVSLRDFFQTSIVIVTHNMGIVSYMADKIGVMYDGEIVEYGLKRDVLKNPKHLYTKSLISAIPQIK